MDASPRDMCPAAIPIELAAAPRRTNPRVPSLWLSYDSHRGCGPVLQTVVRNPSQKRPSRALRSATPKAPPTASAVRGIASDQMSMF